MKNDFIHYRRQNIKEINGQYFNKDGVLYGKNSYLKGNLKSSISDSDYREGLTEIITELQNMSDNFCTHSMNEGVLEKKAELEMLNFIISYLEEC